jgi:uncharacterized protein with PIN domain
MKIIKRGTVPEDVVYLCQCRKCKTTLEFTSKDEGVKELHDPRDGNYFKITCPVCTDYIFVDTKVKHVKPNFYLEK